MSKAPGYVKAYRSRYDHKIFRGKALCELAAWDWICSNAAWQDTEKLIGYKTVNLSRGELSFSVRYLANAWGWKKSRVLRFLTLLKIEAMIGTRIEADQTVITVCNYEIYQADGRQDGTASGTASGTVAGQSRDSRGTNKKKLKEIINTPQTPQGAFSENFEGGKPQATVPSSSTLEFWERSLVDGRFVPSSLDGKIVKALAVRGNVTAEQFEAAGIRIPAQEGTTTEKNRLN